MLTTAWEAFVWRGFVLRKQTTHKTNVFYIVLLTT